jgi:ATP-dependent exoDNAse (exonuclease V) beta subunit
VYTIKTSAINEVLFVADVFATLTSLNPIMNNEKNFTVYQASAGSGKTYTLAKEYIRLCLMHYPKDKFIYRKILAITFTNKAVNEMKERILLFLELLAENKHPNLLAELSESIEKSEIFARAKEILTLILHNYSNFSIYTIDSLFQRIVQSFAIDLKIPLNHQLELDSDTLMSQIVDLILSKLGYDKDITQAIIDFSCSNIEEEKTWHIERELAKTGKEIYKETAISHLKKLETLQFKDFDTIVKQIDAKIAIIENKIINAAQNACHTIVENGVEFNDFYYGTKGIGQWFYKKRLRDFEQLSGNSYVQKTVNENIWYSNTCKSKEIIEDIALDLKEYYYTISREEQNYRLLTAIRKTIYPVVLLNEIRRTSEDLKQNDKLIHISDANLSIFESIKNEPVPFVYERIGERYKYLFIDEFQDTSNMQWQNILPLVVEMLSSSLFGQESGKVIIFGDAKQAIYRFRGGDVSQFVTLPELTQSSENEISKEQENILKYNYQKMFLQKNYRSKKEIVEFNNEFFNYLTKNEDDKIKNIYSNSLQDVNQDNIGGAVFLSYLLKTHLAHS